MIDERLGETLAKARTGFWSWDRSVGSVEWDRGVERLFGLEPGTFEGTFEGWTSRIHPDDLPAVSEHLQTALRTGGPILIDHRCVWPDGSVHWLECRGGLVTDQTGRVTGAAGISIDIDYRRMSEEERRQLLESERSARRLLEGAWEQMARLHAIAVHLAGAVSLRDVAQVLVVEGTAALRADRGLFYVVDTTGARLTLEAETGLQLTDPHRDIPLESDLPPARVARSGGPIVVSSRSEGGERSTDPTDPWASPFVLQPVPLGGEVRAVLAYGYDEPHALTSEENELLDTIVGIGAQAVHRAGLHDAAELAATRSGQLESVLARLAGATTRPEIVDIIVHSLIPAVGAQKGTLYLVDEEAEGLRALAIHGYSSQTTEEARLLPLDDPNAHSEAVRSGKAVYVAGGRDFAARYPHMAERFGTSEIATTTAVLPLIVEGQTIGTIGLGFDQEQRIGEEERRHLSIVAGICAQALGRAHAFEEARDTGARLHSLDQISDAALSRLSLADLLEELPVRIAAAIGCDAVRISLVDEANEYLEVKGHHGIPEERLTRVPIGRGLSGTIAELGAPRVIADITQHEVIGPPFPDHVTSEAGVPLRSGGRVIGVLDVGSGPQRPLTETDLELLEIAADRVATAIDRSRTYELERAERARSQLVGRLSEILDEAVPFQEQLDLVSRLFCEDLADCCALTLVVDAGGSMTAAAHRDPDRITSLRSLVDSLGRETDPGVPDSTAPEGPRLHSIPEEGDRLDSPVRHMMEELDMTSLVTLALPGVSRPHGRLLLGRGPEGTPFGPDELSLIEDLASRLGTAIDGRLTFERHRRTAVTLQRSLLPSRLPSIEGLDISARYWPASESFEVGGDFYDVIELGSDRWGIMVGDVSGKGVEAAALTGIARHTARAAAQHGIDPAGVLMWVHEAFLEQAESTEAYCTAIFGLMERRETGFAFQFAVGGHPLPIHCSPKGASYVGCPGTVLGLIDPVELTESETSLRPGESLLLYTDGVTDIPVDDAITDEELLDIVDGFSAMSAAEAMEELDRVLQWRYGHFLKRDDTAALMMSCGPRPVRWT